MRLALCGGGTPTINAVVRGERRWCGLLEWSRDTVFTVGRLRHPLLIGDFASHPLGYSLITNVSTTLDLLKRFPEQPCARVVEHRQDEMCAGDVQYDSEMYHTRTEAKQRDVFTVCCADAFITVQRPQKKTDVSSGISIALTAVSVLKGQHLAVRGTDAGKYRFLSARGQQRKHFPAILVAAAKTFPCEPQPGLLKK